MKNIFCKWKKAENQHYPINLEELYLERHVTFSCFREKWKIHCLSFYFFFLFLFKLPSLHHAVWGLQSQTHRELCKQGGSVFGKVTRLPAPADYALKINRWQFNFALQPTPPTQKKIQVMYSLYISEYTAENNGKFSLRLEDMFKCSMQISSLCGPKIHIEKLDFLFKTKIISLDPNSHGAPQQGFSTACQNYAPKFYKKFLQAFIKVYIKYIVHHKFEWLW